MKTTIKFLAALILGAGLFISGCAKKQQPLAFNNPEVAVQFKSFGVGKEAQADALAKADGQQLPSEFKPFFVAATQGDWLAATNRYVDMKRRFMTDGRLRGSWWQPTMETYGAFEQMVCGGKYAMTFGNDIIQSIPVGSIYFGGTDPGRFLVTALQKSHLDGDPFFTLTQNALADGTYLDYLQSMYGDKIYVPTKKDSQKCFQDYMEDVRKRTQNNQLKPGEDIHVDSSGRMQVSGQVAVMEINGLLVKIIFDKNPNHEFYIEESFPLDWMYPYLEPHGLIMKLNRQPLAELSDQIVQRDHDYWAKYAAPVIGDWLNSDTSVKDVAAFAEKVYVKKDFNGFTGDPQFVQNDYSRKMFSKLRSSHGGLYAWRAQHAVGASEKERMNDAADFAFRQAWALCPYSPEAVFRYVNFLLARDRAADALVVAETAAQLPAMQGKDGEQMRDLVKRLKEFQKVKLNSTGGK